MISKLPPNYQTVLDRFITVCQTDPRILAAFLGGSYARQVADAYSDLDLYLVTSDDAFRDFYSRRYDFIQQLGQPVFLEDFDLPNFVFYILADGTEGELGFGCENAFGGIHHGPYQILVDKNGLLAKATFPDYRPDPLEQTEKLRRLIYGFWHEVSHFVTAVGRHDLWWAQGQIEALRRCCVNLARLRNNFDDAEVGEEAYFKIACSVPVEQLADLRATFCRLDKQEVVEAGFVLVQYYREQAIPLAQWHSITYPEMLERMMIQRLEGVRNLG